MLAYEFPTDAEKIYERLIEIDPKKYDQTRSHLDGFVSRLSPYITHGFLTLPLVRDALFSSYRPLDCYRFIFELSWHEFFQRWFARYGEKGLLDEQEPRKTSLTYLTLLPNMIRDGQTEILALDFALRELYAQGYMHNHARMWVAAFLTHFSRTEWQIGARLYFYHLLDGDLASNWLSWQWIFGTFSEKPYYFNQENINKYSPLDFNQKGTFLDKSYEQIFNELFVQKNLLVEVGERSQFVPESEFTEIENDCISEENLLIELSKFDEVLYIHEWMINLDFVEEFDPEHKTLRLFIIDKKFWEKYPASSKRFRFMVDLAKNIHNVKIFLGDPASILKKAALMRGSHQAPLKVSSQEYFSENIKSNFTSLRVCRNISLKIKPYPWLVPDAPAVPGRFSVFFRSIERSLFGGSLIRPMNSGKKF